VVIRVAVAVALCVAPLAAADVPLARERTTLPDGAVTMRLPASSAPLGLTLVGSAVPQTEPLELLFGDREVGCAPVERLSMKHPLVVYGAAPLPRMTRGRALVYAAYAGLPNGTTYILRFYLGADDIERAATWVTVGRAIASTLEWRPDPLPSTSRPATGQEPLGWHITPQSIRSTTGSCTIVDGETSPVWGAPEDPDHEPGTILGDTMYWAVWKDDNGRHAEALVAVAHRGYLHVRCVAATTTELDRQRRLIEAQWAAPSASNYVDSSP
jgi:hypothetical protein